MKLGQFFATLAEIPKKIVEFSKSDNILFNGEENDYAERVDGLIQNSVTTQTAVELFSSFITGKGIESINTISVNSKKKITFFKFFNDHNESYAEQKGIAVHVQYTVEGIPDRYEVLPFMNVRKGKKDDRKYVGKYAVSDDGFGKDVKKTKYKWLDAFNPDPKTVQKQIERDGGINKYKGQIYFFNPTKYDYPITHFHAAMNDADSEFRASVFKNKSLRKGFFGKHILITPPQIDTELRNTPPKQLTTEDRIKLKHLEDLKQNNDDVMNGFVGVENNEGFMSIEMEFEGDDIDKVIKHIKIPTDIDDKLFAHTETSTEKNIRKRYFNIPAIMMSAEDKGLFGNSGEALKQAKIFYQQQTERQRKLMLQSIKDLFEHYPKIKTENLEISPLVTKETNVINHTGGHKRKKRSVK
jgi:hypothetical protein